MVTHPRRKYARETLVTTGEHAPTVGALRCSRKRTRCMLSSMPPGAQVGNEPCCSTPIRAASPRTTLTRYWQGLSLFIDNAPALSVLRMRRSVENSLSRVRSDKLEVASTLTPQQVDDLGVDADVFGYCAQNWPQTTGVLATQIQALRRQRVAPAVESTGSRRARLVGHTARRAAGGLVLRACPATCRSCGRLASAGRPCSSEQREQDDKLAACDGVSRAPGA